MAGSGTAITPTAIDAALKVYYRDGQKLNQIKYDGRARPFLAEIKKGEDFEGDYIPVPIMYEDVGGRSCTFTTAQSNNGAPGLATFQMDVVEYHGIVEIEVKTLRKMKSNKGSFLRQTTLQTDSMLNGMANDLEKSLFRDKTAKWGQCSALSAGATSTITLANKEDAKLWSVGDYVAFADGSESPKTASSAGNGKISAINRDAASAQITINCNVSTGYSSAVEANDYLYREGDYTAADKAMHIHGLEDFIPTSVTPSESFNGVDRSVDRQRLAGFYKSDGSTSAVYDSIMELLITMYDNVGPRVNRIYMDASMWKLLADELDIDVQRSPRDGKLGYSYIEIAYPGATVRVVPATFCQPDRAWLLAIETWELISAGKTFGVFNDDGNVALRTYNDASIEIRGISFPQLVCHKPGWNGRVDFS